MRKMLMVRRKVCATLVAVLAVCGVAMADWAGDYAAWKAIPLATRFTTSRDQAMKAVDDAPVASLAGVVQDISAVVFDAQASGVVRAYAADVLWRTYDRQMVDAISRNDKPGALAIWTNIGTLADIYKTPDFSSWVSSYYWYMATSDPKMVKAGFVTQAEMDADLDVRIVAIPMAVRIAAGDALPARYRPAPADVLAFVRANAKFGENLAPAFTYLADAYTNGTVSAKDYNTALKVVIQASIDRMNNMAADDPALPVLQKAIRGFKTSFENLQITEKGNL